MSSDTIMETQRLILRSWRPTDLNPFASMCADEDVMRYFPAVLSREETARLMERAQAKTAEDGFCVSPIVLKSNDEFLGFVGLSVPAYPKPLPFDPCVEIGWRLKKAAWGKGYASEAAGAWLRFGFETTGLEEIVSFTAKPNMPSQKVMRRIGMSREEGDDFIHPMIEPDHPLAAHVLYRLSRETWSSLNK